MYKIGNLKLKNPYFLAPMAAINDIAFRKLCLRAGAGLVYTGMINPLTRKGVDLDDKPALQLFSTNERGIKEFIKKYDDQVRLIDFNLGCAAGIAKRKGFGAFLKDLKVIEKILKTIRNSTNKPITVKLRKTPQTFKVLKIAEKYCDAVCIHARDSSQGYSGKADVDFALKVREKTFLPIIYSGDVNEGNVKDLLKKFDFVMIGREAIGNPNVFSKLTGGGGRFSFKDYLKLASGYKIKFAQLRMQAVCFTRYHPRAKELRLKFSKAKSINELKKGW